MKNKRYYQFLKNLSQIKKDKMKKKLLIFVVVRLFLKKKRNFFNNLKYYFNEIQFNLKKNMLKNLEINRKLKNLLNIINYVFSLEKRKNLNFAFGKIKRKNKKIINKNSLNILLILIKFDDKFQMKLNSLNFFSKLKMNHEKIKNSNFNNKICLQKLNFLMKKKIFDSEIFFIKKLYLISIFEKKKKNILNLIFNFLRAKSKENILNSFILLKNYTKTQKISQRRFNFYQIFSNLFIKRKMNVFTILKQFDWKKISKQNNDKKIILLEKFFNIFFSGKKFDSFFILKKFAYKLKSNESFSINDNFLKNRNKKFFEGINYFMIYTMKFRKLIAFSKLKQFHQLSLKKNLNFSKILLNYQNNLKNFANFKLKSFINYKNNIESFKIGLKILKNKFSQNFLKLKGNFMQKISIKQHFFAFKNQEKFLKLIFLCKKFYLSKLIPSFQ